MRKHVSLKNLLLMVLNFSCHSFFFNDRIERIIDCAVIFWFKLSSVNFISKIIALFGRVITRAR